MRCQQRRIKYDIHRGKEGWVYFLLAPEVRRVKVGWSAAPKKRTSNIQENSPVELHLLCKIPGTVDLEEQLHDRLADWQYRGEWFYLTQAVKVILEEEAGCPLDWHEPEPVGFFSEASQSGEI